MQLDVEKFVGGLHDYLSKAFAPLVKRLEALEARQSERGEKGEPGPEGSPGAPGLPGADGKSVVLADLEPLLKSMQSEWALDFERRAQALFQKAVDAIPKPVDGKDGTNGVDGIGWDSMRVEHDGRRSFEFIFTKDGTDHPFKFSVPCVIDAGFYQEGMKVEKGDGVTFGGSYWIAQTDTDTKPAVGNPDYRLAVRKGRDGKRD